MAKAKDLVPILVAALGWAAFPLWGPAAVALTFLACFVAIGSCMKLNVPVRRTVLALCVAAHAAAVWAASASGWLGAAVLFPPLLALPGEGVVRRFGYGVGYLTPIGPLLGGVCLAAAWPPGPWGWATAPMLGTGTVLAFVWVTGMLALRRAAPSVWKVQAGSAAPAIRLPARDGQSEFDLATERGRYVMLCFLRGDWCPVCHVHMRMYRKEAPLLAEHKVKLVAISPSHGPEADEMARQIGVDYLLLVDGDCQAAQQFGAIEPKAFKGHDVPLPASFLVDPQGVVRWASRPEDVTAAQGPMDALRVLRESLASPAAKA